MSGRDEEPIKDFPSCPSCEITGKRFVYWIYKNSAEREKDIFFNPGVENLSDILPDRMLPVPVYDEPDKRMCTLEELDAIGDGLIRCDSCQGIAPSSVKEKILYVARRKIEESLETL